MTSLDQIVLPLAESRALVEKVKLDTAMVWVRDNDDQHVFIVERSRTEDICDLKGEVTVLCDAWFLSELLDAIRARAPEADIDQTCGHFGPYWRLYRNTEEALYGEPIDGNSKDGSLVQLAALLLEVAK